MQMNTPIQSDQPMQIPVILKCFYHTYIKTALPEPILMNTTKRWDFLEVCYTVHSEAVLIMDFLFFSF